MAIKRRLVLPGFKRHFSMNYVFQRFFFLFNMVDEYFIVSSQIKVEDIYHLSIQ